MTLLKTFILRCINRNDPSLIKNLIKSSNRCIQTTSRKYLFQLKHTPYFYAGKMFF